MALGHLDPSASVLLQLCDGLAAFADDGARHHRGHEHFEVVCRLHRCKKTRDYGLFRAGRIWDCDLNLDNFVVARMERRGIISKALILTLTLNNLLGVQSMIQVYLSATTQKMYVCSTFTGAKHYLANQLLGKENTSNRNIKLFFFNFTLSSWP